MKKVKLASSILAALLILVMLVSCGNQQVAQTDPESDVQESDIMVGLVMHSLNGSFFLQFGEGAEQAGRDLGITVNFTGPATQQNLSDQVSMIENYINAGYDAVITSLWDESGFNSVIKLAQDKGVLFLAVDADAPDSGRDAFIGVNEHQAAYAQAMFVFENLMNGQGRYILGNCAPTETVLIERVNTVREAAANFPGIEEAQFIDYTPELSTAYGIIENAYMANPDVTAIIGVCLFSEAIGNFIDANDLIGKVYGAGFDLPEGTLNHIKKGSMSISMSANPWLQGYHAVVQAWLGITHGFDPMDMEISAAMITKENVEFARPE